MGILHKDYMDLTDSHACFHTECNMASTVSDSRFSKAGKTNFLALPGEIRNHIYSLSLPVIKVIDVQVRNQKHNVNKNTTPNQDADLTRPKEIKILTALLCVSRQISHEIQGLLRAQCTLRVPIRERSILDGGVFSPVYGPRLHGPNTKDGFLEKGLHRKFDQPSKDLKQVRPEYAGKFRNLELDISVISFDWLGSRPDTHTAIRNSLDDSTLPEFLTNLARTIRDEISNDADKTSRNEICRNPGTPDFSIRFRWQCIEPWTLVEEYPAKHPRCRASLCHNCLYRLAAEDMHRGFYVWLTLDMKVQMLLRLFKGELGEYRNYVNIMSDGTEARVRNTYYKFGYPNKGMRGFKMYCLWDGQSVTGRTVIFNRWGTGKGSLQRFADKRNPEERRSRFEWFKRRQGWGVLGDGETCRWK